MDNNTSKQERVSFVVNSIQIDETIVWTELADRGFDRNTIDVRWFASPNAAGSVDAFVETLIRPGTGDIRWQDCDPSFVPALTGWVEQPELNYHLTWTESGTTSSGWTDTAPGAYPVTDDTAAHIVAPGAFVRAYCAEHDPGDRYPGTAEQAARAWAREQGYRAG